MFASDTRTNAGVDQVAIFPKMHVFEIKGERVLTLLTAGNLGITQSVVNRLRDAIKADEEKHLHNVTSLFEAAELVGAEMRRAYERDAEHLKNHNAEFNDEIADRAREHAAAEYDQQDDDGQQKEQLFEDRAQVRVSESAGGSRKTAEILKEEDRGNRCDGDDVLSGADVLQY